MRFACCLLFLILLGGCMTPRAAEVDICKTYHTSAGAPSEVAEILALDRTGAVKICMPDSSGKIYRLLSTVGRGPLHTCQYLERSVFKHIESNGHSEWSFDPAMGPGTYDSTRDDQFMAPPEDMCPPHGDKKYVAVSKISEDVFLRIVDAWRRIMNSPMALEKALHRLEMTQGDNQSLRSWYSEHAQRGGGFPYNISLDIRASALGISSVYELSFESTRYQDLIVTGALEQDEFVISGVGIGIQ